MTSKSRTNVFLYINFDRSFTGGPRVVYNLVDKLDKQRFNPLVVTNKPSELTERLAADGYEFVILDQHHSIGDNDGATLRGGIFQRLIALRHLINHNRRIKKLIREHNCGVLWVRNVKGVLLTGVAARWCRVPLIWDIGMEKKSRGTMHTLHNIGFRLATKVITEAKCVGASIFTESQLKKNSSKLTVIKSGIPDDRVESIRKLVKERRKREIDNCEGVVITNIASVCERKNQAMIVRCVLTLIDEFPKIRVKFIGPAVEEEYITRLQTMIVDADAEKHFEFFGWRDDATELLVNSDIFLLTSRVEGVPYAILEAMHAEIPVISTRCGGVPDVITNGVTGITTDIDQDNDMVEGIRALILDREKALALARNANDFVNQHHTADSWCEAFMSLFDKIAC